MRRNEVIEARDQTVEDLSRRIKDTQDKVFHLRFQMAIEGSKTNLEYSRSRKTVAQLKTILRAKELSGDKADRKEAEGQENG